MTKMQMFPKTWSSGPGQSSVALPYEYYLGLHCYEQTTWNGVKEAARQSQKERAFGKKEAKTQRHIVILTAKRLR